MEQVCLRAMARRPLQRYPSAGQLAADLDRLLLGRRPFPIGVSRTRHLQRTSSGSGSGSSASLRLERTGKSAAAPSGRRGRKIALACLLGLPICGALLLLLEHFASPVEEPSDSPVTAAAPGTKPDDPTPSSTRPIPEPPEEESGPDAAETEEDFRQALETGRSALARGEIDQASQSFQQAIDLVPDRPDTFEAYRWLGEILLGASDLRGAETQFERALRLRDLDFTRRALALHRLARIAWIRGDQEKGLALLEDSLRSAPDQRDALLDMARYRIETDDPNEARRTIERLLEIHPDDLEARDLLTQMSRTPGSPEERFDRALAAGNEAVQENDLQAALRHYSEAIDHLPDQPRSIAAYTRRGFIYYRGGDYDRARRDIERSLALPGIENSDRSLALINLGMIFERLNRLAEAQKRIEEGLEVAPGHPFGRAALAWVFCRLGRNDEAAELAEAIAPDHMQDPGVASLIEKVREHLADRKR